jgi:hypothetical protein
MSEKYETDFDFFWKKINNGVNFSFVRFADGEIMLMKGLEIGNGTQALEVDGWKSPNKLTLVGKSLKNILDITDENFYFAISSITDNEDDYLFLFDRIKNKKNITFANLWINSNYKRHIQNIKKLKRDVIMICNKKAQKENFPFNVTDIITFPNDCIEYWENNSTNFINSLLKKYDNVKNKVFFVCCGPISEIIISSLHKKNPNNTYVDMGSSLDEYIHQEKTRPYMIEGSYYSNIISKFP